MIHRHRGNRRKQNYAKAIRKAKLAKSIYFKNSPGNWYNHLHQFSKNKIHCSCPMCSSKTNNKHSKCFGPVNNYTVQDRKNRDRMDFQMVEWLSENR